MCSKKKKEKYSVHNNIVITIWYGLLSIRDKFYKSKNAWVTRICQEYVLSVSLQWKIRVLWAIIILTEMYKIFDSDHSHLLLVTPRLYSKLKTDLFG